MENKVSGEKVSFERKLNGEIAGILGTIALLSLWATCGVLLITNWFFGEVNSNANLLLLWFLIMFGWFSVFMLIVYMSNSLEGHLRDFGKRRRKNDDVLKEIVGD